MIENKEDVGEIFICECHSLEHIFVFSDMCDINGSYDESGPYIHIFLKEHVWYKRILTAIKYIFGFKTKYGHYDEIILKPKDIIRLKNLLETSAKNRKTNE